MLFRYYVLSSTYLYTSIDRYLQISLTPYAIDNQVIMGTIIFFLTENYNAQTMQVTVGWKEIMKIGYTVFYIFESARLQSKALYRRSLYRLFQERSPYRLFSKGAAASIRTNNGFRSSHEFTHSSCNPIFRIV